MLAIYLLAAAAALVPATLVPLLAGRGWPAIVSSRTAGRARRATAGLGRVPAALVTLLACSAAVIVVCWPLGEALSRAEQAVDRPVFRWVQQRQQGSWTHLNAWITLIGERSQLKVVCLVAAVVFAVLWRRRWWVPVLAMGGQFVLEQYVQEILKRVVDRGHPPTALGTFPSGGCARVIMTFGTIALLAALTWRISARGRVMLCTAVAVAASIEGYTRVYLQKHWLTDVIGGWLFGGMLLLGFALSVCVLVGRSAEGVTENHADRALAGPVGAFAERTSAP